MTLANEGFHFGYWQQHRLQHLEELTEVCFKITEQPYQHSMPEAYIKPHEPIFEVLPLEE